MEAPRLRTLSERQSGDRKLRPKSRPGKYDINQKTVAKWRGRDVADDMQMGPEKPSSTVLTTEEEAMAALRKHTLLPPDDCLYALQAAIPHLSRSALHRCCQRHRISRLPDVSSDQSTKKKFRKYPAGCFHIDSAEVRTEEGRLCLFVAVDRTSKFAYVELHERQTKMIAAAFLHNIHTILTDNGIRFTNRRQDRYAFTHVVDRVCDENPIEHRLTRVRHPWTDGQVGRMNRTIKEATVKRYQYGSHEQLKTRVYDFMMACNFAKRLKTLKGLTSYEYICKIWTKEPERFSVNPFRHTVELNI